MREQRLPAAPISSRVPVPARKRRRRNEESPGLFHVVGVVLRECEVATVRWVSGRRACRCSEVPQYYVRKWGLGCISIHMGKIAAPRGPST